MGRPGRAIALACLLVAVCAGLSLPSQAAPAASAASVATSSDPAVAFQIDPAHSGGQPSDSLSPPLSKQWDLDLHGPLTYPLIANGRAFVIANGGVGGTRLYALDLQTGTALWGPIDLGNRPAAAAYDAVHVGQRKRSASCQAALSRPSQAAAATRSCGWGRRTRGL